MSTAGRYTRQLPAPIRRLPSSNVDVGDSYGVVGSGGTDVGHMVPFSRPATHVDQHFTIFVDVLKLGMCRLQAPIVNRVSEEMLFHFGE